MSLLCHNTGGCRARATLRFACIVIALLAVRVGEAQQIVFSPRIETTAEWDSNPYLQTHGQSGEWFQALVVGDWLRQSARSSLEFRPQVMFQDSTLKAIDRYEALVNLKGSYQTERSVYSFVAEYHRQDVYNAEYGVAAFNPLNPDAPNTTGTGFIVTGVTRDSYQVSPTVSHQFTERFNAEVDATFLAVRYSTIIADQLVAFNSGALNLNGVWALSQRSQLAVGPFFSLYDPTNPVVEDSPRSRSYGASFSYRYLTSKLNTSVLTLKLGRDEQDQFNGPRLGSNTWGLEWKGTYKWQTSQLQFVAGRLLEPSSLGGEIAVYQVRAQFLQQFTPTFSGDIAARVSRQQGVGVEQDLFPSRNRGYAQAQLTKLLSREFYLSGGYRLLIQKLSPTQNLEQDHGVYLTIGWHPLEPR
jgi:hypothetical protein